MTIFVLIKLGGIFILHADKLRESIDAAEERLARQHEYAQDLFTILRKLRKELAYKHAMRRSEQVKRQKSECEDGQETRYTYNKIKTRKFMEEQQQLRREQKKLNNKVCAGLKTWIVVRY